MCFRIRILGQNALPVEGIQRGAAGCHEVIVHDTVSCSHRGVVGPTSGLTTGGEVREAEDDVPCSV